MRKGWEYFFHHWLHLESWSCDTTTYYIPKFKTEKGPKCSTMSPYSSSICKFLKQLCFQKIKFHQPECNKIKFPPGQDENLTSVYAITQQYTTVHNKDRHLHNTNVSVIHLQVFHFSTAFYSTVAHCCVGSVPCWQTK